MFLSVGEISKILGVSTETVRHYVQEGVISPQKNEENNYWEYSSEDFLRLTDVLFYRSAGLSVKEIKTIMDGIPVEDRICGLTMMMYDIAKNVVRPAMTSVDTVVPFSLRWKNFSISLYLYLSWVGRNVSTVARRVPARIATRLMESWDSEQRLTVTLKQVMKIS